MSTGNSTGEEELERLPTRRNGIGGNTYLGCQ